MSDISSLADVTFAEKDADTIEAEVIAAYEESADTTLADADPRKILLDSQVPILTSQRAKINQSARMNLLAYAKGDYLDHIGIMVGCTRIAATAATVTLEFTLSESRSVSTTIPSGTRVTSGDSIYFATDEELVIAAGDTTGTVSATCTTTGDTGNDYAADELTTIVDTVSYVDSVTNTDESSGGADEEDDDTFRARIQLAPESFSTAGPTGAYEYWAKTASSEIADVKPYSPSAGNVALCILMDDGELPSDEILADVLEICSADEIRPLTDNVTTEAPTQVEYDIDVAYYISKDNKSIASTIETAVEAAVASYQSWQKEKLGRHIDPSELSHLMKAAGASRVVVTSPTDTALDDTEVAKESSVNIDYKGTE